MLIESMRGSSYASSLILRNGQMILAQKNRGTASSSALAALHQELLASDNCCYRTCNDAGVGDAGVDRGIDTITPVSPLDPLIATARAGQNDRVRLDRLKVRPWFELAAKCLPDGQEKPSAPPLPASGCADRYPRL
jgi:hypothetical protein